MARYHYIVLARAQDGQEQAYRDWYDGQHLADVARVPGVITAKRFDVAFQKALDIAVPQYHSLAIYEIETDDPEGFLAHVSSLSGSDAMPSTPALNKAGMIQIVGLAAPSS